MCSADSPDAFKRNTTNRCFGLQTSRRLRSAILVQDFFVCSRVVFPLTYGAHLLWQIIYFSNAHYFFFLHPTYWVWQNMCLAQVKFRPEPVRVLETFFSWKKLQPDICFYRVGGAEKHFGPKCVLAHLFLPNLPGNGKSVLLASKCFFFFVAPTLKRTGYHYQWGPYVYSGVCSQ